MICLNCLCLRTESRAETHDFVKWGGAGQDVRFKWTFTDLWCYADIFSWLSYIWRKRQMLKCPAGTIDAAWSACKSFIPNVAVALQSSPQEYGEGNGQDVQVSKLKTTTAAAATTTTTNHLQRPTHVKFTFCWSETHIFEKHIRKRRRFSEVCELLKWLFRCSETHFNKK